MPAAALTEKGQIVIPAEIRERYQLTPGTQVEYGLPRGGTRGATTVRQGDAGACQPAAVRRPPRVATGSTRWRRRLGWDLSPGLVGFLRCCCHPHESG